VWIVEVIPASGADSRPSTVLTAATRLGADSAEDRRRWSMSAAHRLKRTSIRERNVLCHREFRFGGVF
jgi:hypothetical protein